VAQRVAVPEGTLALALSGYRRFKANAPAQPPSSDTMRITLVDGLTLLQEVAAWGNQDVALDAEWQAFDFRIDAAAYAGSEITLELVCDMGPEPASNFFFDDLSLIAECAP
jgi:hypothetical protein